MSMSSVLPFRDSRGDIRPAAKIRGLRYRGAGGVPGFDGVRLRDQDDD